MTSNSFYSVLQEVCNGLIMFKVIPGKTSKFACHGMYTGMECHEAKQNSWSLVRIFAGSSYVCSEKYSLLALKIDTLMG